MIYLASKKIILIVLLVVIAAPVAYYLVSPLFITVRVQEELPGKPGSALTVLATGSFIGEDDFHRASGTAKLVRVTDGNHVIRFEEFQVTNGPDLYVYLARERDISGGFVDLGRLKGNVGDQNYDVPSNVDLTQHRYILIWCRAFSVLFGSAEIARN